MHSDVVGLIKEVCMRDVLGDRVVSQEERGVWGKVKSIGSKEFYQAMSSGLKPEVKLEIYAFEYNQEQLVCYKGKMYKVIRTYASGTDKIELTLGT